MFWQGLLSEFWSEKLIIKLVGRINTFSAGNFTFSVHVDIWW